jgi:hypothetical protein
MDKIDRRNAIGGITLPGGDNVAIALAMYFDGHPAKPDEEIDDQLGWTPWVIEQVNATLDAIVTELREP